MTENLVAYKSMPEWTADSLPKGFRKMHNTKEGTWARLKIFQGSLTYFALDETGEEQARYVFSPERPAPFVEPQAWHRVEPASEDLRCQLEFYCQPERYYEKKYKLTAPHSEVIGLLEHMHSGDALDLGCGRGRNSVFLQTNGFRVTAVDRSEAAIKVLRRIIRSEPGCAEIRAFEYDATEAAIKQFYDLIVVTVVLQFLPPDSIPAVISNLQEHTRPGGINLVVAPISSDQFPCPIDLPFTFSPGELKEYYKDWEIIRYDENPGTFHRLDETGNRYSARFATLVARNSL